MAKRQALGRHATIGELYDVRTDCFCNGNLFASLPPPSAVLMEDVQANEFRTMNSSKILPVLAMFRVEGELQLSVSTGLCALKGLAAQLVCKAQTSVPQNETWGILFTYKTKKAKLCWNGDCKASIANNTLKMTGQATHAVEEVVYGVNTLLCLEFEKGALQTAQTNLKNLQIIVENCINEVPYNKYQNVMTFLDRRCNIQIFSDILSSKGLQMQSVQHALDYIKSVPKILGGIGFPLSYTLMPIVNVTRNPDSSGNQQLRTVPNEMVFQLIKCMEENVIVQHKVQSSFDALQKLDYCISDKDLKRILDIKRSSKCCYGNIRKEFADLLVEVRSGRKLPVVLQTFWAKERPYSPKRVEQMLFGLKDAFDKAKVVGELLQKGVHYVAKDVLLADIVADARGKDVHVLHFSTDVMKSSQAQWKNHKKTLEKLAGNPNTICLLFDHDFDASGSTNKLRIDHYKHGKMIEVAPEGPCYAESPNLKPTGVAPKKRAYLRLFCPGNVLCGSVERTWQCKKCKSILTYGFDETFYCSCGSASCWSFRFLCSSKNHGAEYLPLPQTDLLSRNKFAQALGSLMPLRELNILLLGETGVGKSTWINSFVNYLTYETMEEAERNEPRYLIASSFIMTDEKYQPVEIKMGVAENENNSKGQSTTQVTNSYVFSAGELLVRLIDTPGVGDTRGIVQDKENFRNVLSHLAHLEDIHGICILLKSNSARMTITFQFCIKELLTHLHKDACKNIVFVFTNARETFYRPGDTFATLRSLLMENKDIAIELSKETIYCMDNEAVRFLAATRQGIKFRPEDRTNYSISWQTSVAENERLVQHILSLASHSTRKTLSLNEARRLILGLTEPLAQISQNIQNNIILAQNRRDEVNGMVRKSKNLKGKLNIPVMDIEPVPIPYPRTVCTSSGCTEHIDFQGLTKVNYKTWCHEHCYLRNVQPEKYPCPELQNCAAMENATSCKVCGCSWDVHIHITYECMEVMKQTVDKNVERLLSKESNSISAVEAFIKDVEQRISSLKCEQETINKVASKCGNFLKQNAITPYNDSVDEYLQQCIRIQKDVVYGGGSDQTLKGLEKMLASYRQEVKILEMSMKDVTNGIRIGPHDIQKLIRELYTLPINGKTLKSFVDVAMNAQKSMALYQEKVYVPPVQRKNAGFLKRALSKAMNSLGARAF